MASNLYDYLPWRPEAVANAARPFRLVCRSWGEGIRLLEDAFLDRIASVYWSSYDDDMRPRSLTEFDNEAICYLLNVCRPLLERFDSTIASDKPGESLPSSHLRDIDPGDWGLLGKVARIAELKYLQGRHAIANRRDNELAACAWALHRASSICFEAREPDVYLTGVYFRHHWFLLLADLMRSERLPPSLAKNAIAAALNAPTLGVFAETFLAPAAFRAVSLLEEHDDGEPRDDVFRRMLSFVPNALYDKQNIADATFSDLAKQLEAQCDHANQFTLGLDGPCTPTMRDAFQTSDVIAIAELIGMACKRCIDALGRAACLARNELAALQHSFRAWTSSSDAIPFEAKDALDLLDEIVCKCDQLSLFSRLYVEGVARSLCSQSRRNGFFWYWPVAQNVGAAAALAVNAFSAENCRRPRTLNAVVDYGLLPNVPISPFSGKVMQYDEDVDFILAEGDEVELQYWNPASQNASSLRWRTYAARHQGDCAKATKRG